MTSISSSIPPGGLIVTDPSKIRSLADAVPVSYGPPPVWDDPALENQFPADWIPENRPDNIWGKVTLTNGEVAIIYNGGSVETETMMFDIDWNLQGEQARAQALIDRYGGVLKLQEQPEKPPEIGTDMAAFWSKVMDSPALADRLLGPVDRSLMPDENLPDAG